MMKVLLYTWGTVFIYTRIFLIPCNLYLQQIAEQKLKAFSIGTMGKRPLSKKELEEQRKKEQEQAAAQVNNVVYNHSLLYLSDFI